MEDIDAHVAFGCDRVTKTGQQGRAVKPPLCIIQPSLVYTGLAQEDLRYNGNHQDRKQPGGNIANADHKAVSPEVVFSISIPGI